MTINEDEITINSEDYEDEIKDYLVDIPANFKSKELILLEQIANDISEIKETIKSNISSLISYPIL